MLSPPKFILCSFLAYFPFGGFQASGSWGLHFLVAGLFTLSPALPTSISLGPVEGFYFHC